jgi:hypothetical protein
MDTEIPAGMEMDDFVDDIQDYAMEVIIGNVADKLSGDDAIALDGMIEADATVAEIDTWLCTRVDGYDEYVTWAIGETRKYIGGEDGA